MKTNCLPQSNETAHISKTFHTLLLFNALYKSLYLKVIAALSTTVMAPFMRALFTGSKYLCLCFIKVIVLAPISVCFSTSAAYLSRVLSCNHVLFITASLLRYVWEYRRCAIQQLKREDH